jgi:hypothetical protein
MDQGLAALVHGSGSQVVAEMKKSASIVISAQRENSSRGKKISRL